jgi:hypothetical protein
MPIGVLAQGIRFRFRVTGKELSRIKVGFGELCAAAWWLEKFKGSSSHA